MSNIMSNIKPNQWYDTFAELSRLDNPIDQTKKEAILLRENDEYLENVYMKIWEHQKSKLSEGIDIWDESYYDNDIFRITEKDFEKYYFNMRHDISGYFEFIREYNNRDGNKSWIEFLKKKLNNLEKNKNLDKVHKEFIEAHYQLIKLCEGILEHNYLVSEQLWSIYEFIEDAEYSFTDEIIRENEIYKNRRVKKRKQFDPFNFDNFRFNFSEDDIIEIVKKEVKWRKKERDIEIYKQRQRDLLLDEIASHYHNLKDSAISKIIAKVKGAINYYKGKVFEREFSKYLNKLKIFDKVILGGESGKPDIIAYDLKNNILYVFSLKNLKIDHFNYYIKKELLKQEIIYSMEKSFEFTKVILHIVVLNNVNNHIQHFNYDYRHPKNLKVNP